VLSPKGRYKGQKLNKLVRIKIPAKIKSTIASIPEMTCVKYNTITKAASARKNIVVTIFFIRTVRIFLV
jgi:hypothetical protein